MSTATDLSVTKFALHSRVDGQEIEEDKSLLVFPSSGGPISHTFACDATYEMRNLVEVACPPDFTWYIGNKKIEVHKHL